VKTVKALLPLRAYRFEKIINLYQVASIGGALAMGTVFSLLQSPCKIGHDRYGFGLFLDEKVPENFFQERHMAESILELACIAGGKPDGFGIEVFPPASVDPILQRKLNFVSNNYGSKTIAINPGSDASEKRTAPMIFSSAVNRLATRIPVKTIILGGPGEEHLADKIFRDVQAPAINLAGKISLEDLVYVLNKVDLLITNDSGPMHIAAALKKPLVALFRQGNSEIFGPYGDPSRFRIIVTEYSESFPKRQFQETMDSTVAAASYSLLTAC
jgi:ADP-heptose:LPS heptosyltransferase